MKIILLGLSFSGKTTTAKYLEKCGFCKMIDIDAKIEEKTHMSVRECYEKHGRDIFRKIELNMLKECILVKEEQYDGRNIVISTGGGIIENKDAIFFFNNLKQSEGNNVVIFFLVSSLKTLWVRCSKKIKKEKSVPAFLKKGVRNISFFWKYNDLQAKLMEKEFLSDKHARKKILKVAKSYFKLIYKKRMAHLPLLDCIKIKVHDKKVCQVATYIKRLAQKGS